MSAARDAAFARMLHEHPDIEGYFRWCLIAPPSGPGTVSADDGVIKGDSADEADGDGLAERLVDFTLTRPDVCAIREREAAGICAPPCCPRCCVRWAPWWSSRSRTGSGSA